MISQNPLQLYNFENHIKWVSRYYGDGYGFDILSYDYSQNKEKLIEVKSGLSENFVLTENELNVMLKCHLNNADYYIYKYYYDTNDKLIHKKILKYEPRQDKLYYNLNNFYEYTKYEYENQYGFIIPKFSVHKIDEEPKKLILK